MNKRNDEKVHEVLMDLGLDISRIHAENDYAEDIIFDPSKYEEACKHLEKAEELLKPSWVKAEETKLLEKT